MPRALVPGRILFLSLLALGPYWALMHLAAPAHQPGQPPQPSAGPAAGQGNPLDEPIAWLLDARRNFTQVRNYTSTLIKRERVRGILQDQNIILFSAKVQPFSIYMKWVSPPKLAGQEVAFVDGRNRNMMRVRLKGIGGVAGFQPVAPNDPRVMEHSRHNILEAGLGHMIEQNLKNLQEARNLNKTSVTLDTKFTFDKRPCIRIETVNRERLREFYCYRSVLYLEKVSKLPMRMENYDWPTQANPNGDLLEEFSFADLNFNVDMRDDLFNK